MRHLFITIALFMIGCASAPRERTGIDKVIHDRVVERTFEEPGYCQVVVYDDDRYRERCFFKLDACMDAARDKEGDTHAVMKPELACYKRDRGDYISEFQLNMSRE